MNGSVPEPGQVAIVRQRPFVVTDVQRSELPLPATALDTQTPQHLVTLSSVEDEGLGEELQVVWEMEPGAVAVEKSRLPMLAGFDHPRVFDAFLDAVTWGSVSQADASTLQAPFRSGIDVDDYQLDPVVRALSMPRVNLLVADDVGLGKTIEAGLVTQELILRHRVRSILIVCPSSIQIQWKEEMRDKFGLEFRIVDSDLLSDLRRRRGIRVNPWTHFPRLITSIDYLKRERPMRLFRETLPAGDQPPFPRPHDLLILDEAHNVAPPGRGKYALDSLRTTAIRVLAPYFEHRLFLTATPHNGYPESFSALLELLDNQRFARAIPPNRTQLEAVMVRRMKSELELKWDGCRRFAKRDVKCIEVPYTEDERRVHRALQEYAKLRTERASTTGQRYAVEFVLKLLKKRLFSSPAAFATTLAKHRASMGAVGKDPESKAWRRQVEEADDDFWNDENRDDAEEAALETASRHSGALVAEEKKLLSELSGYATRADCMADSKSRKLVDWLKQELKPHGEWSDERVIIFTEYRATQKWLFNLLAAEGLAESNRLMMMYGGMQLDDREKVKAAFQAHPSKSPVRILLATDAASEGLNLQNHCWRLIHYEIPWNPNRMEQRNGRVDRHGQKNDEVHVFHFVSAGFEQGKAAGWPGELEGDLEFLMRAVLKVETIREDLMGKVGPVIASQVEEAMLGRRQALDTTRAERDAEPMRRMLKFERELREQLRKLTDQLRETERNLRLSPANIENVVEVGLGLAGQPPLRPAEAEGIWPDPAGKRKRCPVFHMPPMKGSWRLCADGLPHPHTGVVRPIVFDHSLAAGRDDVVLCHLNHRLVQMCLQLLRAEIWSQSGSRKLNRFTTRMVPDTALQQPAVIVHGRLLVLGGDNQRVHEEIIMAGGMIRAGRFSRMNVGETRDAYAAANEEAAPGFVEDKLKELWSKFEVPLFQSLDVRMKERTANLQSYLDKRCSDEVASVRAVMEELAKAIRETLDAKVDPQMEFDWSESEKSQRNRDLDGLRGRLADIPAELEREAEHLKSRYKNPQPRLFPIAVTFLVPPRAIAEIEKGGR
ncbi:MAG: DISARM system SNF2-like helicase DrmD [Candidatus Marinimicrobia bacterium]|nr:DISARM system SNF2-like helicase DrmD [Candidatus Neomarinimicrobiota bacterium]